MKNSHKGYKLPDGLKIGERFLLSFDLADATPQSGRLQDMNKEGALCIDVAPECQPPFGTPVTISTMPQSPQEFRFSSEILGRSTLDGRLPVLLVKAPNRLEKQQRRNSFRISAALKSRVMWEEDEMLSKPAALTNLSGGGARLYMRTLPQKDRLLLTIDAPDSFIEEWAMRQVGRLNSSKSHVFSDPFEEACTKLRDGFSDIETRLVKASVYNRDERGPIYALAVSFAQPNDGAFRLVSYLQRQALQRGVHNPAPAVATAA